ncbi:MAG: carboxypeptidase-like regulatory domain-containing protein [Planctomycetota bacterium]
MTLSKRERFVLAGATFAIGAVVLILTLVVRGTPNYVHRLPRVDTTLVPGAEWPIDTQPASRPVEAEEGDTEAHPEAPFEGDGGRPGLEEPVAGRPSGPVGTLSGRITDEGGTPLRFASVTLAVERREVDDEGEETKFSYQKVADCRANASGVYRLETRMGGELTLRAVVAGYEDGILRRNFSDPPFQARVDLALRARKIARARGRLLDLEGTPLRPVNLLFLFPEAVRSSGSHRVRDFWGASGIYAATEAFCPGAWRGSMEGEQASVDLETATFEVEVPAGSERIVTVVFRDLAIAEERWRDGDPPLEFRIDVPGLNRTLGTLDLDVLDAQTLQPVAGAEVSLRKLVGDFGMRALHTASSQPSLQARGLPPGPYAVEVLAPDYAATASRVEIPPFGNARAVVELARRATVRLNLVPVDGWLPEREGFEFEYRNVAGLRLPCPGELDEKGESMRLGAAPPGSGFLLLGGNALRLELASGDNADRGFPLRRPRRLKVRFRPRPEILGPQRSVVCEARLLGPGGIPVVETVRRSARRADGRCLVTLDAPPGIYTLELTACRGKLVRGMVQIGEETVTETLVDSP